MSRKSLLQQVIDTEKLAQVNNEAHADLTEILPEKPENIFAQIDNNAKLDKNTLEISTKIQSTVLSIYRQHTLNPLSSAQVQKILDEKLDKQYHKTAWNILIKMV